MTRIGEPVREPYEEPAPIKAPTFPPIKRPAPRPAEPEREPVLVPVRRTKPAPLRELPGDYVQQDELPENPVCPKCGKELKAVETQWGLMLLCPKHAEGYLIR